MHGIVFQQLQTFVTKNHGFSVWQDLLLASGLNNRTYLPTQIYPDDEAFAIVTQAAKTLNIPVPQVLEKFGEFISANLIKIYGAMINPEWRALDLIEHTENTMHKAVRFSDRNATPPPLVCKRIAPNKVQIEYNSHRQMVDLGVGIIKGFGVHYNEKLDVVKKGSNGATILEVTKVA